MQLPLSSAMTNQEIAELFSFIAQVLNLKASNYFRARAYEEAAVVVSHLPYELQQRFQELQQKTAEPQQAITEFQQQLDALPGIGEAIAAKLAELFTTGNIKAFQKYVAKYPGGIYPLMKIHGIGAKKALRLAEEFELNDPETAVDELLTRAKHGLVKGLAGFGDKSEEKLIADLQAQHHKARIPYQAAQKVADQFKKLLAAVPGVKKVEFLGSLRRGAATVGDIDLGVAAQKPQDVVVVLEKSALVRRVLVAGENLLSVISKEGWQVDIKFAPLAEWGSFIQHFTGDKQHNIKLREYALKKGLSLSEHGIKIKASGKQKKFASEKEFYRFLGLRLIPPAERSGAEELSKYRLD